jgi:tetratricopeptide (TPR) repeat protein
MGLCNVCAGFRERLPVFSSILALCALVMLAVPACAQRPTGGGGGAPTGGGSAGQGQGEKSGASLNYPVQSQVDLMVSVREPNGMPLSGSAVVKLYTNGGFHLTMPTQDNSTATFSQLLAGEYELEVSAVGYKTANEHASVTAYTTLCTIYVYMHSESEGAGGNSAPNGMLMSPKLQAQIDKGLEKMRRHQYDGATAQLQKAAKMAPASPDIQYLLGMVEYSQEHFDAARAKFQTALSMNPSHERSLLALGELQLRLGAPASATDYLEKAYQANGADWRAHYLLANAYVQQGNYEKALSHARKAAELGKERAPMAFLLLGKVAANVGKRDLAKESLQLLTQNFPNDSNVPEAKSLLASLEKGQFVPVSATPVPAAASSLSIALPGVAGAAPLPPPAPVRPWGPPDIDAKEYPAVEDVSCSDSDIVQRTQARMKNQLGNFEKFLATEHIEHQEVDAYGIPGVPRSKDFNYLVFIEHPRPGYTYLEESRDGGANLDSFPTSLATQGLVALAVNVFDPNFEKDLTYQCEGLGSWRGQAAWRVRFEQRKDVPSEIRMWRNSHGTYPIPLKGRVWIDASSFDVLHIETDLREPVPALELTRDHLVIDYGPVKFDRGGTTLWLPWDAEMFMELHGKRYHHTHTLRNYMLFSIDTANTIAAPKQKPEEEKKQ